MLSQSGNLPLIQNGKESWCTYLFSSFYKLFSIPGWASFRNFDLKTPL